MVNAADLKSVGRNGLAGSNPTRGTNIYYQIVKGNVGGWRVKSLTRCFHLYKLSDDGILTAACDGHRTYDTTFYFVEPGAIFSKDFTRSKDNPDVSICQSCLDSVDSKYGVMEI